MIKIDKDVPLPPHGNLRGGFYPFSDMEVGDSFFVQIHAQRASGMTHRAKAKFPDRKFTQRGVTEGGVKGTRIWRIA